LAVEIHENFDICQGLVLFFASVKLVEMMKINRRMGFAVTAMSSSLKELSGFAIFFVTIYMAFCRYVDIQSVYALVCSVFYLLLSPTLLAWSSFLSVNEEAFSTLLNKFSFTDIVNTSWIGEFTFLKKAFGIGSTVQKNNNLQQRCSSLRS
jgi:hypothetical protein